MTIKTYIEWLKKQLDEKLFIVSQELNIDAMDEYKIYVVVSQQAGTPTKGLTELPIKLTIYTSDPEFTMDFFTGFAQMNTNTFLDGKEPTGDNTFKLFSAQQIYYTPTIMDTNQEFGTMKMTRIVLFLNLFIFDSVNNITKITIDGEEQPFRSGAISYQVETHGTRVSGEKLSIQKKTEATTGISYTAISTNNIFGKKLSAIRQGRLSGNTKFLVELERRDESKEQYTMIVRQNQEPFSITGITNINVELALADFPKEG